ncbi:big defensin-like [Branchiostoma floridae x Branchiostoma belcheri]
MEKKTAYCMLFLVLLVPYTTLGAVRERAPQKPKKEPRVVPAIFIGAAVSPLVYQALVFTFGAAAVAAAGVAISNALSGISASCANNRGWCRPSCFSHEEVSWWNTPVCLGNFCCVPTNN